MRSLRKPSKKTAKAAIKPCRFAAYLRDLQQRPEPSSEAVAYKKRATERAGSTRPRRMPRGILITAITGTALIAGLVLAWYVWTTRAGSHLQAPTLTVVPLTSFGGYKDFGSHG